MTGLVAQNGDQNITQGLICSLIHQVTSMGLLCIQAKNELVLSDNWGHFDDRPIHVKEADAILKTLKSMHKELLNSKIDVLRDNTAVVCAWSKQGSKSQALNEILKSIFHGVVDGNIDLHVLHLLGSKCSG